MRTMLPEPHSTRAIEFSVGMALDTTPEVVLATLEGSGMDGKDRAANRLAEAGEQLRPVAGAVQCPVLVVQGGLERIAMPHWAQTLGCASSGPAHAASARVRRGARGARLDRGHGDDVVGAQRHLHAAHLPRALW
jgi:hypothetical protein